MSICYQINEVQWFWFVLVFLGGGGGGGETVKMRSISCETMAGKMTDTNTLSINIKYSTPFAH